MAARTESEVGALVCERLWTECEPWVSCSCVDLMCDSVIPSCYDGPLADTCYNVKTGCEKSVARVVGCPLGPQGDVACKLAC